MLRQTRWPAGLEMYRLFQRRLTWTGPANLDARVTHRCEGLGPWRMLTRTVAAAGTRGACLRVCQERMLACPRQCSSCRCAEGYIQYRLSFRRPLLADILGGARSKPPRMEIHAHCSSPSIAIDLDPASTSIHCHILWQLRTGCCSAQLALTPVGRFLHLCTTRKTRPTEAGRHPAHSTNLDLSVKRITARDQGCLPGFDVG